MCNRKDAQIAFAVFDNNTCDCTVLYLIIVDCLKNESQPLEGTFSRVGFFLKTLKIEKLLSVNALTVLNFLQK